jgi:hypothetical protein
MKTPNPINWPEKQQSNPFTGTTESQLIAAQVGHNGREFQGSLIIKTPFVESKEEAMRLTENLYIAQKREFMPEWTAAKPTEDGIYLIKFMGQWPIHRTEVKQGRWQETQDPARKYAFSPEVGIQAIIPVDDMRCAWFGPLPTDTGGIEREATGERR